MNRDPHLNPDTLGEFDALPESDPRRLHVSDCARCQAALAAYRAFLEKPTSLPEGELVAARARLSHARAGARISPAPSEVQAGVREARPGRTPWWASLGWKPALAAAAAVLVAVVFTSTAVRHDDDRAINLRGEDRAPGSSVAVPVILDAVRNENGGVVIRWASFPGADAYRVILLGPSLAVLSRLEAERDTVLSIPSEAAHFAYCQVAVLQDGEEVATSPMRSAPVLARTRVRP